MVMDMDTINLVKESLNQNVFLSSDIKKNIEDLMVIFHRSFPEVSLEKCIHRLKTLNIKKSGKFLYQGISNYVIGENTIYFNIEQIQKGYDMKHILMFELLNVITATDRTVGFDTENKDFLSFQIGYTEMLTNALVGNDSDEMYYPEEMIVTDVLTVCVGEEEIQNAYFQNNSAFISKCIKEMGE